MAHFSKVCPYNAQRDGLSCFIFNENLCSQWVLTRTKMFVNGHAKGTIKDTTGMLICILVLCFVFFSFLDLFVPLKTFCKTPWTSLFRHICECTHIMINEARYILITFDVEGMCAPSLHAVSHCVSWQSKIHFWGKRTISTLNKSF